MATKTGLTACVTCGEQYEVCKKCEKSAKTFESWRMTACCPSHWKIAQAINDFFYERISAEDAQKILVDEGADALETMTPITEEYVTLILSNGTTTKNKAPQKANKVADMDAK